ncbi:hypothetical protein B0J11DRAFT_512516 [Dendryphion nanum]|uniref:Rhodopsin domain-containing protein n=1 Tax=Dendryphion nanum TaxID=256645 RepID=A0A9P9I7X2_9PLEO|nr:hypothetical protein B0J11DRAFT_512516 [Dendryphion nanum]
MWDKLPNTPEFRAFMQTPTFLSLPAMSPPDGVKPNFENPDHLSQPYYAVFQLVIVTLVVAMRIYIKTFIVKRWQAEDYWVVLAWVSFAGFHVIVFMAEALPLGVHQWDLTIGKALQHAKLFHIGTGVYGIVMLAVKIAIMFQIRKVFIPHQHTTGLRPLHRCLRQCIDATLALNLVYYIGAFIFQWCSCVPIQRAWDPRVNGKCVSNQTVNYIISGAINSVTDLIIIVVPQPVIWTLRMDRRKQWGLSALFGLGILALMASIVRLRYAISTYFSEDKTYYAALMGKWAEPELTWGFIAICMPVLPALIKRLKNTALGRRSSRARDLNSTAETYQSFEVRGKHESRSSHISVRDVKADVTPGNLSSPVAKKDGYLVTHVPEQKVGDGITVDKHTAKLPPGPAASVASASSIYIPLNPF